MPRERIDWKQILAENWQVLLIAALIAATVIFAPEAPVRFIYTEF